MTMAGAALLPARHTMLCGQDQQKEAMFPVTLVHVISIQNAHVHQQSQFGNKTADGQRGNLPR
jgi:hypothetical protein